MQSVRIYEIPDCRMASSGVGMFGDGTLERFDAWLSGLPRSIYPKDFLYWDGSDKNKQGFCWLRLYEPGLNVPAEFPVIDFRGGLYAVTTDIDQRTDWSAMDAVLDDFLKVNGLERDASRLALGNIITSPCAKAVLGYEQMNYWTPVKPKTSPMAQA